MITRLLKRWFATSNDEDLNDFVRAAARPPRVEPKPEPPPSRPPRVEPKPESPPRQELSPPPDENSLIRNKYVREDTGTHETLKILDDSMLDSGEEEGFDPYNTGDFDRSRNWERRFKS